MNDINPQTAAEYALIAISLVLIGGIITAGQLGIAERGSVLAGTVAVLFAIAYRRRRRGDDDHS